MNIFKPEPKYIHPHTSNIGVLLINLGTPSSYNTHDIKKYLSQFLQDKRVVELPKFIWLIILYTIILPFRSKSSALKYKSIWTNQGSPLLVNTQKQILGLQKFLKANSNIENYNFNIDRIKIAYAMRYNTPSISSVLYDLKLQNINRLIILPLYPQYCSSTVGSTMEAVFDELKNWRVIPSIHTVNSYHDNKSYIDALSIQIQNHWLKAGKPNFNTDKLLFSFHGIPQKSSKLGDSYYYECITTVKLLAKQLNLQEKDYITSFQSRVGKAKWLEPYTDETLKLLAKNQARVDIICPGFASDCLETLEEIAIEGKNIFLKNGGRQFEYIPCLNDSEHGIHALGKIILEQI